jgi:hypothetical protein
MPHAKRNRAKSTWACRPAVDRQRPHLADKRFELTVPAGIPSGADLVEEPHGRELRIGGQARLDDRFVGLELGRHGRPWPIPHLGGIQIPFQIARSNPTMNGVPADAQPASQRTLARALLQIVLQ